MGNAIMSFYSALIDLLGRCAPEMHVSSFYRLLRKCRIFVNLNVHVQLNISLFKALFPSEGRLYVFLLHVSRCILCKLLIKDHVLLIPLCFFYVSKF